MSCGPTGQGIGALEFMLTLAQAWLCEAADAAPPCGQCGSCRLLQSGSHPDLHLRRGIDSPTLLVPRMMVASA